MRKTLIHMALFAALTLISGFANAKEDVRTGKKASFKTEAGDCVTPQAQFDLDINNVRARLLTGGDAWWNLSEARYEVPKGDKTGVSLNALFAGAIWITGYDQGGNLKCAAQRYRGNGDDYWPGPLDVNGQVDKATCNKYDHFFSVLGADIDKAQAAFLEKGSGTSISDIPKGLLSWPAKGNQYLASDPTLVGEIFNINDNLAPFHDADGDQAYDPVKGDFPIIPCRGKESEAYADQMIFWVFNDVGNLHTETSGQAIGVQINALAFAFQTTDDINNMTFYKYEITNKSSNQLNNTYISQWADPDLGCYSNDRVGCDTSRSLGIIYNDGTDGDCNGVAGYQTQLPMLGIDFFEGPLDDNSVQLGLTSFVYFTNGAANCCTDPNSASQYRNYMTGLWNDGTNFTETGTGYNSGGPPTKFLFPGEPCDATSWSDYTSGQAAGDRRFVQTSGPFTLKTGQPQYVTIGCVFVRPPGVGVGSPPCFNAIRPADDKAQLLFDRCFQLVDGPAAPTLAIREMSNELIINLVNLRNSNNYGEQFDDTFPSALQYIKTYLGGAGDPTYTFEGYLLYQVSNSQVSAEELATTPEKPKIDPTKVKLVAQVDVRNGVSSLFNYEKDVALNLFVPVVKVKAGDAHDAGIQTSFNITEDAFATGANKKLVNHKTYYYAAIAYAYNDYKTYDPTDPNTTDKGQLAPYLQGRKNFQIYSAIPHIPDPRNEGTVLNSKWGDATEVKRIEGQGNGANNLQLDAATIERIVTSGDYAFSDILNYVKGYDPIGFQVTDPVKLKEADFELQFVEDTFLVIQAEITNGPNKDTVSIRNIKSDWLSNYDTIAKILNFLPSQSITNVFSYTLQDYRWKWDLNDLTNNVTIPAERYLDRPYEQLIAANDNGNREEYGFSIKLGTPPIAYTIPADYPFAGLPVRYVYSDIQDSSSIEYQNSVEQWLSFVQDEGVNTPNNWIRSGELGNNPTIGGMTNPLAEAYDDNYSNAGAAFGNFAFDDTLELFEDIINGSWAPYCLAANYAKKSLTTGEIAAGKVQYSYGPGFKWKEYTKSAPPQDNLDKLASVDVVITPDRNKWTRCVVFETGEDDAINEGTDMAPNGKPTHKGQIRMHYSWDKDNNWYMDGSHAGEDADTGRSWFPGYAINVETGERLNMAFGESSDQPDQNGTDMKWNPTKDVYSPIGGGEIPFFGGKHFIYVMSSKYDKGVANQRLLLDNYTKVTTSLQNIDAAVRPVYYDLMWTSIPYLARGYSFADGYIPPAEVKVKLRVEKPFNRLATNATNGDPLPRYQFSTKGLGATEENHDVAVSACDMMRAVPNPYLAYSAYETDQNSNKIKITNLPNNCNITIYALDGTIVRKLSRAIGVDPASNKKIDISDGAKSSDVNLDNSIEWDLKNDKSIPVAGGIYLIHIDAPGICEKTIKWFGAIRPADTSNF